MEVLPLIEMEGAHPVAEVTLESFSTNNESDYEHEIWKKVLKSMRKVSNLVKLGHRAPFFPCSSRFSPSYFRIVGRRDEFEFTVTVDVIGVELTSLDLDPKMAFDVAYHGLAAGHCNTSILCGGSRSFPFLFFLLLKFFSMSVLRLFGAGLLHLLCLR